MKIAIYHNLGAGGGKRVFFEYARELSKSHHVDLYILSEDAEKFADMRGVVKETFDYGFKEKKNDLFLLKVLKSKRNQKRIAADIDAKNYDVVLTGHCSLTKAPLILRYLKTPSVYYCQEPFRDFYEYSIYKSRYATLPILPRVKYVSRMVFKGLLDRSNALRATLIIANSYFSAEAIYRAFGVYPRVSYLGVDASYFKFLPEVEKTNEVLSVGPLDSKKGHMFIIRALGKIDANFRPVLNIVYYGEVAGYKEVLQKEADNLGVVVRFNQNLSDDKIVDLYNKVKITLCAQELEPFGLTPLESMSCGTPVIAVREGGMKETVIDDYNGLLIDRVESDFGLVVERVLRDRELWEKLRDNGIEFIKNWNWEKQTERLLDRFTDVAVNKTS